MRTRQMVPIARLADGLRLAFDDRILEAGARAGLSAGAGARGRATIREAR